LQKKPSISPSWKAACMHTGDIDASVLVGAAVAVLIQHMHNKQRPANIKC
jgi:hypothetical protein